MTPTSALLEATPAGRLRALFAEARERRLFSAAAWAVGDASGTLADGHLGTRAWADLGAGAGSGPVDAGSTQRTDLYDLASVTKPLVAVALFSLVERGALTLGATVSEILPAFRDAPCADSTVRSLLLHTSGLPGRVPMYQRFRSREALLRGLTELPLVSRPGSRVEYSSQGFMIVGLIAEAVSGLPLDRLVGELVAGPAGAASLGYRGVGEGLGAGEELGTGEGLGAGVVATELDPWRGRVVQGEVHDENAVVLGGVAGHAGLFGSVDDLAAVGRALVRNRHEAVFMAPVTFRAMTTAATGTLRPGRTPGWEAGDDRSSAGDLLGPRTFGHTGFTGTSLFVDPDADRWYVLLTNRVHPSRSSEGIGVLRRTFHNVAGVL